MYINIFHKIRFICLSLYLLNYFGRYTADYCIRLNIFGDYSASCHYGNITVIDTCFNHRIAFHLTIECCFWVPNQITIEIQCLMAVVFSWRWESGFYARS